MCFVIFNQLLNLHPLISLETSTIKWNPYSDGDREIHCSSTKIWHNTAVFQKGKVIKYQFQNSWKWYALIVSVFQLVYLLTSISKRATQKLRFTLRANGFLMPHQLLTQQATNCTSNWVLLWVLFYNSLRNLPIPTQQ